MVLQLKEPSAVEVSGNHSWVPPNAQDTHPSTWNFGFERKEIFKIYVSFTVLSSKGREIG